MPPNRKTGFQYVDKPEIKLPGIKKIVVLGDTGCTGFYDANKKVLGRILEQKADLFLMLGDLVFTGADEEFQAMIDFCNLRVKVPIFALAGNHDLPGYSKFFGRRTYALVLDHHVCFFLCDATGHFSDEDLEDLKTRLNQYPGKNFIILTHIPPPIPLHRGGLKQEEWEKLRSVLDVHRQRIAHIFCGHIHGYHEYLADGYPVTITAGGGAVMIHELVAPAQKMDHSILLSLHHDGSISTRVFAVPAAA